MMIRYITSPQEGVNDYRLGPDTMVDGIMKLERTYLLCYN